MIIHILEAHFKTMKYKPGYQQEVCDWIVDFVDWYNDKHYSGLNYLTHNSRYNGKNEKIKIK